uniref:XAF1 factor n=1 Tax=Strix occidentalis caurina TaxID=311401 RepID=A0A8D0FN05_STROC
PCFSFQVCKQCKQDKRDVSAANFSLHEAHCLRFLTLCPECDEPVAQKDIKDHQTEAHKQVRNKTSILAVFSEGLL